MPYICNRTKVHANPHSLKSQCSWEEELTNIFESIFQQCNLFCTSEKFQVKQNNHSHFRYEETDAYTSQASSKCSAATSKSEQGEERLVENHEKE